jgi:hypothetical protein
MVFESGWPVTRLLGLGHPQLDAMQLAPVPAGRLLGMGHPTTGGHQIQLPSPYDLLGTEAVAMQDLAGHEPGDGLQPDVRVRTDAEAALLGDRGRTHVVGEAPRPDRAMGPPRQGPPDPHGAHLALAAVE